MIMTPHSMGERRGWGKFRDVLKTKMGLCGVTLELSN